MSAGKKVEYRQQFLVDQLAAAPDLTHGEAKEMYFSRFDKGITTFNTDWKKAQAKFSELQEKVKEAKEDAIIKAEIQVIQKGLMVKNERLLVYQDQVYSLLKRLRENVTFDIFYSNGEQFKMERPMTVMEENQTIKTLKEVQKEISLICGDYVQPIDDSIDNNSMAHLPAEAQLQVLEIMNRHKHLDNI